MSAQFAAYGGAVAVVGTAAVTWAARLMRTPARTPDAAPFVLPAPGTRYLPCHTARCAHMTHPHLPHGDGSWRCRQCGNVKGGAQQ